MSPSDVCLLSSSHEAVIAHSISENSSALIRTEIAAPADVCAHTKNNKLIKSFFSDQMELQQIGSEESILEEAKENRNQDSTDVAISETEK